MKNLINNDLEVNSSDNEPYDEFGDESHVKSVN